MLLNVGKYINEDKLGKSFIGNNCNIRWDVKIMSGVNICDNCIIGEGAIVTKDISPNSIAIGVPTKDI